MIGSLLRLLSLLCCAFVIVSFALFAVAQTSTASRGQAHAVAAGTTGASAGSPRGIAAEHQPRRFIDTVAQKLNSPWAGVVDTHSAWIRHIVPTLISLLLYGFVLGLLARWASGQPR